MTVRKGNALRRLEELLDSALQHGDPNRPTAQVFLDRMRLQHTPENLVAFYSLMSQAKEEAGSIRTNPKIDKYIEVVDQLLRLIILHDPWKEKWGNLARQIQSAHIVVTLDSLANTYYSQKPSVFWEDGFLNQVIQDFNDLLNDVLRSDLSEDLKTYIENRVSEIIKALRKASIEGTSAIEKETKSLIGDLAIREINIKGEDKEKEKEIFRRFQAHVLALVIWAAPSPSDLISAVPAIRDFWIPTIEQRSATYKEIEKAIMDVDSIQEAANKARDAVKKQLGEQKALEGRDQKALPAAEEDSDCNT